MISKVARQRISFKAGECSGCRACELVCALTLTNKNSPVKAALRVKALFPSPGHYEIVACDQCGKCAEACPTGAIALRPGAFGSAWTIDGDLCSLCGACAEACPFHLVIWPEGEGGAPPTKCDLCGECVAGCPLGVIFIEREGEGEPCCSGMAG